MWRLHSYNCYLKHRFMDQCQNYIEMYIECNHDTFITSYILCRFDCVYIWTVRQHFLRLFTNEAKLPGCRWVCSSMESAWRTAEQVLLMVWTLVLRPVTTSHSEVVNLRVVHPLGTMFVQTVVTTIIEMFLSGPKWCSSGFPKKHVQVTSHVFAETITWMLVSSRTALLTCCGSWRTSRCLWRLCRLIPPPCYCC